MIKFILFAMLTIPGKEPMQLGTEVPDIETCLSEVTKLMQKPIPAGAILQAGCIKAVKGADPA